MSDSKYCYKCGNQISQSLQCTKCGAFFSEVKYMFFKYIGFGDSLHAYNKSYKLVLLKYILSNIDNIGRAPVDLVIEGIRWYYYGRKIQGMVPDLNADKRILDISNSSDEDIFAVIKTNPYAVIHNKGYMDIKEIDRIKYFVLSEELFRSLDKSDLSYLAELIDIKLQLYYSRIDEEPSKPAEDKTKSIKPKNKFYVKKVYVPYKSSEQRVNGGDKNKNNIKLKRPVISKIDSKKLYYLTSNGRIIKILNEIGIDTIFDFKKAYLNGRINNLIVINDRIQNEFEKMYYNIFLYEKEEPRQFDKNEVKNNVVENFRINEVFPEGLFTMFRSYCEKNSLATIADLEKFDFDSLLSIHGFGVGKVGKIKERYYSTLNYDDKQFEPLINTNKAAKHEKEINEGKAYPFEDIHRTNFELTIHEISHILLSPRQVRILLKNQYYFVKDLVKASSSELLMVLGTRDYKIVIERLEVLTLPLADLIEKNLDKYKETSDYNFYKLRGEGYTLQEVADRYNITRERVRQVCSSFEKENSSICFKLVKSILYEKNSIYISADEILDTFETSKHGAIIMLLLKNCDGLEYLDFSDLYALKQDYSLEERIFELTSEIFGEACNFDEKKHEAIDILYQNDIDFLTDTALERLLKKHNYNFYGDYVIYGNKSYAYLCEIIISEYFPDGIQLYDEEEIGDLRELVTTNFPGLELPDKNRALSSRLANYLILRDRGKYISPANFNADKNSLEPIIEYIDNHKNKEIYFREVFSEFEGYLSMMTAIDNYNYLHGALIYLYPYQYEYTKDKIIKHTGQESKTLAERINDVISEAGTALSKTQIENSIPGISDIMLFTALAESNYLLQWDSNKYNCESNISISKHEKKLLNQILDSVLYKHSGYCSDNLVYEEVINANDLNEVRIRCKIDNAVNLFYALNYWFNGQYYFRRPHISNDIECKELKASEIALALLNHPNVFSATSFFELTNSLKWSSVTARVAFNDIIFDYIRISKDEYIMPEYFNFDKNQIDYLSNLISENFNNSWYVPLVAFNDCDEQFGKFEINSFFVASLCDKYELNYNIIRPQNLDIRFEKGILVSSDIDINDYDHLIALVLCKHNIMQIEESQLLSFLIVQGLTRKMIPREIYMSSHFLYEDGCFYNQYSC